MSTFIPNALAATGRAVLSVAPREGGGAVLTQTAFFAPKGLMGWLCWCAPYPVRGLIFSGLIARIGALAERNKSR